MAEMFLASLSLEQQEIELEPASEAATATLPDAQQQGVGALPVRCIASGQGVDPMAVTGPENISVPNGDAVPQCPICGCAGMLQKNSVVFCANQGCTFRLDTQVTDM